MGDVRRKRPGLAASSRLRSKYSGHSKADGGSRYLMIIRNEWFPAIVPVLAIFGVYLFVCWVMIWMSMYNSLNDLNSEHDQHHFNKRNDIIAMRLQQFLTGRRDATAIRNQNNLQITLSEIIDQDHSKQIQSTLQAKTGYPQLILGAYLEPALSVDANTGEMKPRLYSSQDLIHVTYPHDKTHLGACSKNGAQWILPTSHLKSLDNIFGSNVFRNSPMYNKRFELANGTSSGINGVCPVDADPFLPWIHDVFPRNDGSSIEFVISNKRRCNTDPNVFKLDLNNLEPQVGNMQPIPVKRFKSENQTQSETRYVLANSTDEADSDGKATKFICRFHTIDTDLNQVVLGETLSEYLYNPEHLNYRKRGSNPMLTSVDKGHDEQIWNSVYQINCPVPQISDANGLSLTRIIESGQSVSMPQGVPSLYIDLIPIRTPVRRDRDGFGIPGVSSSYSPADVWSNASMIPLVENSGRWSNIPICNTPKLDEVGESDANALSTSPKFSEESSNSNEKKHFLVACVWAAESFSTRGQMEFTDSSEDRLLEFLTYNTQIAGFDHIYVYDNSDSSLSNKTLESVTEKFPSSVTRIAWPHRVCNNNRPTHSNPGERSSQYAAEASCRARYGPDTTWMVSLDVDEYLIPTGVWKNLQDFLRSVTEDTKILSFFQTRALPNVDIMVACDDSSTKPGQKKAGVNTIPNCLAKNPNRTYMETYNCEPTTHPKPKSWAWRAKKQIYRPDFVLNHFVHYSVVTRQIIDRPDLESLRFIERQPYERRVNEISEGYLLHSKSTLPEMTKDWNSKCPLKGESDGSTKSCKVGIPSTNLLGIKNGSKQLLQSTESEDLISSNFEPNCYPHFRVKGIVPLLEQAIRSIKSKSE